MKRHAKTQNFLPIQTSPNCPLPSFLISWRDSLGISHTSLVFTDRSASLGMPRLQLPINLQHKPAARSEVGERGVEERESKQDRQADRIKERARARDKDRERYRQTRGEGEINC